MTINDLGAEEIEKKNPKVLLRGKIKALSQYRGKIAQILNIKRLLCKK